MLNTLHTALRQISNAPGFSLLAIVMLALGIGASTAMFSVVYTVLVKPLPFAEPERLVFIENNGAGGGLSDRTSQVENFLQWRGQSQAFADIAAYYAFYEYSQYTLSTGSESMRLTGVPVSENFLRVLGVEPVLGRSFVADEMVWNHYRAPAAILSHAFWQQQFAGDPAIVGQSLSIDGASVTVVGVLPASFDFDSVLAPQSDVQMLLPFPLVDEMQSEGNTLFAIGRLAPGASVAQAQSELSTISERTQRAHPERGIFGALLTPLDDHVRGAFRPAFTTLFAAVLSLLLIVCLNLSNLLLARAQVRRKEWVTRIALGASRWQLIRLPLSESLLLAAISALAALLVAELAMRGLGLLQIFNVPLLAGARIDPSSVAFSVAVAAVAGIVCGTLPALHLWRTSPSVALNDSSSRGSAGPAAARVRKALVVSQIALACALLINAGLLIKSFAEVLAIEIGFDPANVVAWRVDSARSFEENAPRVAYYRNLLAQVAALPGVQSVGLSDTLPFGRNRGWGAAAKGESYPDGTYPVASPRMVDSGYLQTMKVELLKGRYFDQRDYASSELPPMIVNQTMANSLWPGRDALGQVVVNGSNELGRVVGVVADIPRSLEQSPSAEMYLHVAHTGDWNAVEMVVRSERPTSELVAIVREAIRRHDPDLANGDFQTLHQVVDNAVAPRRLTTSVLGGFSALALLLAGLGVYGVVSYSVGQRDKELAIRKALGGQSRHVAHLILKEGALVAIIGVALGLSIAFASAGLLRGLLYGVGFMDPLVLIGNVTLVVLIALVATGVPALRAAQANPVVALR